MRDLAAQAGPVLRNVRLIEELRASRQRLVAAQDEERRKLERNIHDGAQQQLVALSVKLRLAEQLVDRDPAQGARDARRSSRRRRLTRWRTSATWRAGSTRRCSRTRAWRPRSRPRRARPPSRPRVEADGVGRYPREVEAAVYFCVLEALKNVGEVRGRATRRRDARADGRRARVRGRATTGGGSTRRTVRDGVRASRGWPTASTRSAASSRLRVATRGQGPPVTRSPGGRTWTSARR